MRQRSPGTASQQSCERGRERERPRGGALARGAVPQRLPGSSSCLCVTSGRLAGEAAADASKGQHCTQTASATRKCSTVPLSGARKQLSQKVYER